MILLYYYIYVIVLFYNYIFQAAITFEIRILEYFRVSIKLEFYRLKMDIDVTRPHNYGLKRSQNSSVQFPYELKIYKINT